MKTLRTFLAEALDELDEGILPSSSALATVVEVAVLATRDWLAQPEIAAVVANRATSAQVTMALRREAVK